MLSALLDTCVLVPSRARDVPPETASAGAYRPLWAPPRPLDELNRALRTLLGKRGTSPEETDACLSRAAGRAPARGRTPRAGCSRCGALPRVLHRNRLSTWVCHRRVLSYLAVTVAPC